MTSDPGFELVHVAPLIGLDTPHTYDRASFLAGIQIGMLNVALHMSYGDLLEGSFDVRDIEQAAIVADAQGWLVSEFGQRNDGSAQLRFVRRLTR